MPVPNPTITAVMVSGTIDIEGRSLASFHHSRLWYPVAHLMMRSRRVRGRPLAAGAASLLTSPFPSRPLVSCSGLVTGVRRYLPLVDIAVNRVAVNRAQLVVGK